MRRFKKYVSWIRDINAVYSAKEWIFWVVSMLASFTVDGIFMYVGYVISVIITMMVWETGKSRRRKLEIKEQLVNDDVKEEKYISLSEAIKFLADKSANGENILTENELSKYREDRYRSVALHEPDLVPMELWLILKKVDNKDIILYGRNPLQSDGGVLVEIPSVPYYAYNVENWSDDWQEMKYESGKIIYKYLQIDKADLEANLPIQKPKVTVIKHTDKLPQN